MTNQPPDAREAAPGASSDAEWLEEYGVSWGPREVEGESMCRLQAIAGRIRARERRLEALEGA